MSKAELRIRSLLPLLLFICAGQMSATALADTATIVPGGSVCSSVAASRSIDRTGSSWSENEKKQPSQGRDGSPESEGDIDDSDSRSDDLEAVNSSRNDQGTLHFFIAGPDADTSRASRLIPVLLLPVNNPCLREHVRERAPPTLA